MDGVSICAIAAAILGTIIFAKMNKPPVKKTCTVCGMTIPGKATACPYCRRKQSVPSYGLGYWIAIVGGLSIVFMMACLVLGIIS